MLTEDNITSIKIHFYNIQHWKGQSPEYYVEYSLAYATA